MDRKRNEIARSLSMVTQLGISMLAPLILCVCVGIWLDDTFGWSTTAVLVVLGIMAGARNTWMLAQQVGLPRLCIQFPIRIIFSITKERKSGMRHLHPDLMMAPGSKMNLDEDVR